jgi:uncharacterized membrane protein
VQLLILAAPFCAAALLWNKLPPRMAIHWNAAGQVDGYAGRAFAAWFVPSFNVGMALLLGILPRWDPRVRRGDAEVRANMFRVARIMRTWISALISAISLAILAIAIGWRVDMTRVATVGAALLFVVLGNYLTKLRPNSFMGIRTPWTLRSPEVWTKTHRLAAKLMMGGGLVLILLSLVVPSQIFMICAFVPMVLLMTLIPAVYSYRIANRV